MNQKACRNLLCMRIQMVMGVPETQIVFSMACFESFSKEYLNQGMLLKLVVRKEHCFSLDHKKGFGCFG